MASIVKKALGDGSAAYLVRFRTVDGKQRSKQFSRKKDAEAFAARTETEKHTGQFVDPRLGKITLNEWVDQWWPTVTNLRPSTRERDDMYMRRHIRPTFGTTPIASIDRTTIREWLAMLLEHEDKKLAPATVHKVSQILNKALRAAQEDRLISANPAERMSLPKIEREEMRFLNAAEVHRLADAIDPRYRGFVLLGGYGGLRLGEMLALQVGRVDAARQRVRVTETLVDLNGYQTIGPPKTRAAVRTVTVPTFVIEALNLEGRAPTDFAFESPEGGAVRGSSWRRRFWRPATLTAQVAPLRIHDLRHTAISLWIAAGANPKQVAVRAGHSSVSVVFDRYGHLYEDQDAPLLAALEAGATNVSRLGA